MNKVQFMQLKRFFTPGLSINTYLICDEASRRAAVIDPTRQIEVLLAYALQQNIEITDIIETHVHADFLSGAPELKAALDGKPTIHCSGMGGPDWIPVYADRVVWDCDEVLLKGVRLQAWHTPGHTPEHLVWLVFDEHRSMTVPEMAFTGDLIFIGSVGRPDLLNYRKEGDLSELLYHTLFETLRTLPDFLVVLPAHGSGSLCGKNIQTQDSSTLGYERRCNPSMKLEPFEVWKKKLYEEMPAPPFYFQRMKYLNVHDGMKRQTRSQEPLLLLNKEQVKEHLASLLLVDVRNPQAFALRHLAGSINIPMGPSFALWAAIAIEEKRKLLLVVDKVSDAYVAAEALRLVGIDEVYGVYDATTWHAEEHDKMFVSTPMMEVAELKEKIDDIFVVDVRTPEEWAHGHIKGAYHCQLTKLPEGLDEVPQEGAVSVVCHSGNRASIVASLLTQRRKGPTYNVRGGMHAWLKAGLPVEKKDGRFLTP